MKFQYMTLPSPPPDANDSVPVLTNPEIPP